MRNLLDRFFFKPIQKDDDGSVNFSGKFREKYTRDPDFPYLISFPRTGSHWLRLLMELYFEKPALSRAFYFTRSKEFTCYHRHDEDLNIKRNNVIYLYREISDTVYSQMNYYNQDIENKQLVIEWLEKYSKHLKKWLIDDDFTEIKTVIKYEKLKSSLDSEFEKITEHFDIPFSVSRLRVVAEQVTKSKLKEKTGHDNRVVNLTEDYNLRRKNFKENYSELIKKFIKTNHPNLIPFLDF
jgi:hypothetical protein